MKKYICIICLFFNLFLVGILNVSAKPRLEYGDPLNIYNSNMGFNIISYSRNWSTTEKLEQIYNELLNNFHSTEISYLSDIYIYPDSPDGISGAYYESTTSYENGRYIYGDDSYIEIFNGDIYDDISQLAPTISHEYGHHFTYYYLVTYENKYRNEWYDTEYARLRQLDRYENIDYGASNEFNYVRQWDISEIVVYDYIQLFGSKLAKQSIDYKDVTERVEQNIVDYYLDIGFNSLPQENLIMPLATDVEGLYEYWLKAAGYENIESPKLPYKPRLYMKEVENVYFGDNKKYTLSWDEIGDGNSYEYTIVIYPWGMPFFPTPIKTLETGEEMVAHIGSDIKVEAGEVYGLLEDIKGEYEIRLFIKDINGFIFNSDTLYYDFTTDSVYQ